jgi:hypothetical protein
VKHAGAAALQQLDALLMEIRQRPELREKQPGIFYRKSKSFLHFHEDPAGMFADLRTNVGWERFPVNTPPEWQNLLVELDDARSA